MTSQRKPEPASTSALPPVEMVGEGEVTPPAEEDRPRASFSFHVEEFLSRGMSKKEAERLAHEVVARDEGA